MRVFQNTELEEEVRNLASSNSWPHSTTVSATLRKTNGVKSGNRQYELRAESKFKMWQKTELYNRQMGLTKNFTASLHVVIQSRF